MTTAKKAATRVATSSANTTAAAGASTPGADSNGQLTGNEMPKRVPENETEAAAKVGAGYAAQGDGAIRVEGTDAKNNADAEEGRNSAGYASGAPGAEGVPLDKALDQQKTQGGLQGSAVGAGNTRTFETRPYDSAGYNPRFESLEALEKAFASLEKRVAELEEAETSPLRAAPSAGKVEQTQVDAVWRTLHRHGIRPNDELDKIEEEREKQEKSQAKPDDTE